MTSGNMPTRVAMPCPFADEGDVASIGDTTGNTINFKDGFPEVYSTPPSGSGKLVQRNEVNALGKVATQNQFYHQCGGINTFDATFAGKIVGYPKGAVLDFISGDRLYKVISLTENNQVDFTNVGIDNINWAILNTDSPIGERTIYDGPISSSVGQNLIAKFHPSRDCYLTLTSNISIAKERIYGTATGNPQYPTIVLTNGTSGFNGVSVVIYESDNDTNVPSTWNSWKKLTGDYRAFSVSNNSLSFTSLPYGNLHLTANKYYTFGVLISLVEYEQEQSTSGGVSAFAWSLSTSGSIKLVSTEII